MLHHWMIISWCFWTWGVWRWRHYGLSECWELLTEHYGIIWHKNGIFNYTTVYLYILLSMWGHNIYEQIIATLSWLETLWNSMWVLCYEWGMASVVHDTTYRFLHLNETHLFHAQKSSQTSSFAPFDMCLIVHEIYLRYILMKLHATQIKAQY